ncbi:PLP-dependent aminotransferase family protein [Terasakiella sp. A23]|uniref:aminotransferase-like domain-containing protein n=1 Tax=Terasakiella sp. FCG-A23 TaxID=3080561 RepID=UPI002954498C|nr:PLP-dependent aminotransferase family protein [Terasakiella sp. A23]MDV7338175.1 PLP-dependent aminotransferase family protein [Terasakiella sp. A23]
MTKNDLHWFPHTLDSQQPVYLAIVDAIEQDLARAVLKAGDKLPPQRQLAARLDIDFTTVTRAYAEGKKRGLLVARVGQGTFVRGAKEDRLPENQIIDMGMNIPPLPTDKRLLDRMKRDMAQVVMRMDEQNLFGYQDFFGTFEERETAARWVGRRYDPAHADNLLICPGTQGTLLALLGHLGGRNMCVASEEFTYPGFKAVVEKLGVTHIGLEMDHDGIVPNAFEEACRSHNLSVLYCTPTQHNPTTTTWPSQRRREIAEIARTYDVKIIEDDAYGFISKHAPAPLSSFAPELSYYIAGLAKSVASSLRVAFLTCPDQPLQKEVSQALRATSLMVSPITKAMAIDLITTGCADLLGEAISKAARDRQKIAREVLSDYTFRADPNGFHIWLSLPLNWDQKDFVSRMRRQNVRLVAADDFAVSDRSVTGVRLCLGAPNSMEQARHVLELIAELLKKEDDYSNAIV